MRYTQTSKSIYDDVGLALVWLGPWRPWIRLTLESFHLSNAFHLHIISPEPPPLLEHQKCRIHYHRYSLEQISKKISEFIGEDYSINYPNKLCDFKIIYNQLFPEIFSDYSIWGYCDEDIIWGDLKSFYTPDLLMKYDIIASCRCSISGQLTLIRKNEFTDSMYNMDSKWKDGIMDLYKIHWLDEIYMNDVALKLEGLGKIKVLRKQFQTHDVNSKEWNDWANELELSETGKSFGIFKHGDCVWINGKIYSEESMEEFAFFHFGAWKKKWIIPFLNIPPNEIKIWRFTAKGVTFIAEKKNYRVVRFWCDYKMGMFLKKCKHIIEKNVKNLRGFVFHYYHAIKRRI